MLPDSRNNIEIARWPAAPAARSFTWHTNPFPSFRAGRDIDANGFFSDHSSRAGAGPTRGCRDSSTAATARTSLAQADGAATYRLPARPTAFMTDVGAGYRFGSRAVADMAGNRPLQDKIRLKTFDGIEKFNVHLGFNIFPSGGASFACGTPTKKLIDSGGAE